MEVLRRLVVFLTSSRAVGSSRGRISGSYSRGVCRRDKRRSCRRQASAFSRGIQPPALTVAVLSPLVRSTSPAPAARRTRVAGGAEEPLLARRIGSSKRRGQDACAAPRQLPTRARSRRLSLRLQERLCSPARTPRCRSSSGPGAGSVLTRVAARPREREPGALAGLADQAGSKHTGDSRNRGKGGQPVWRSRRPIVEGMEMRTLAISRCDAAHRWTPAFGRTRASEVSVAS